MVETVKVPPRERTHPKQRELQARRVQRHRAVRRGPIGLQITGSARLGVVSIWYCRPGSPANCSRISVDCRRMNRFSVGASESTTCTVTNPGARRGSIRDEVRERIIKVVVRNGLVVNKRTDDLDDSALGGDRLNTRELGHRAVRVKIVGQQLGNGDLDRTTWTALRQVRLCHRWKRRVGTVVGVGAGDEFETVPEIRPHPCRDPRPGSQRVQIRWCSRQDRSRWR
jgi:hypothetical protein